MRRELTPAEHRQRRRAAVVSGVYSRTTTSRRSWRNRLSYRVRKIREQFPGTIPADEPVIRALAEVMVIRDLAAQDLAERGVVGEGGDVRRMVGDFSALIRHQLELSDRLAARIAERAEDPFAALRGRQSGPSAPGELR